MVNYRENHLELDICKNDYLRNLKRADSWWNHPPRQAELPRRHRVAHSSL